MTVLAQHQVVAIAKNLSEQKSHIQDDNTHQTTSCGSQQTIGNEKIEQTIEHTANVSQQQTDKSNQQKGIPVEDALILISPEYADGNLYTDKNSANIKSTSSNIGVQTRKFVVILYM
jgi:K+-transporting ATPase c subunit